MKPMISMRCIAICWLILTKCVPHYLKLKLINLLVLIISLYKILKILSQETKLDPLLFAVLVNFLLKDWQGRIKFVDDATACEIIPRCSVSYLPIVANEILNFASTRGMQLNPKKCKEMVTSFLKYSATNFHPIYTSSLGIERVTSFKLVGVTLSEALT